MLFTSASFLSTNPTNSLKLVAWSRRLLPRYDSSLSTFSGAPYLQYWHITLMKKMKNARKDATPHMRKRPQKLLRLKRLTSTSLAWVEHPLRDNHLLWILSRSLLSDRERMAVDKSTARGESLWKAYREESWRWDNILVMTMKFFWILTIYSRPS